MTTLARQLLEAGVRQGLEQGIEQGLEQGGRKRDKEIVLRMNAAGLSVERITDLSGIEKP